MPHPDTYGEEEEVTMASLAIEFEQRKHEQDDGVRDLKALCLRYGGPDGSDWGELLAWLQARVEDSLSPDVRANREPETRVVFGKVR